MSSPPKCCLLLSVHILLLLRSSYQLLFVHLIKLFILMCLKCNFSCFLPLFHQAPYPSSFLLYCPGNWKLLSDLNCETSGMSQLPHQNSIFFSLLFSPLANKELQIENPNVRFILDVSQKLNKITDMSPQERNLFYRIHLEFSFYADIQNVNSL